MTQLDFVPISVATLMPSAAVGLDLYQVEQGTDRYLLYKSADFPFTPQDIAQLQSRGITRLHIPKDTQEKYQQYLRRVATLPPDDPRVPIAVRVGAMDEVVRDVLTSSLSSENTGAAVDAANHLGHVVAETVTSKQFATKDLLRVLHHDYTTFTHSANVAYYNALLAKEMGYTHEEIQEITTGGLLHDIGKLDIDEKILCKPGKLDEEEFREIQKHPLTGFRKLAGRDQVTFGQLMMVYQHHERLDGRGYPVGVDGDEIHPWAKQCAVVDVFEAVTSQRPYRQPMPRLKALELLERDSGKAFEPEIVKCWTSIIQRDLSH